MERHLASSIGTWFTSATVPKPILLLLRNQPNRKKFISQLLKDYNSLNKDKDAWCPILGVYMNTGHITASHLFAYKHGQETMDEMFGKRCPEELFSSRNGLVTSKDIERYFDSGVLVIVPDKLVVSILSSWVSRDV
ncbi:hypothetical protein SI65_05730 [Aspergillus cristatus]|uniref:HNH nuclease domain-containing protein n=1 Tax=Aspergillus cristatus TaxID=573508 RepID=A0A1E3BDR7_ASPCR|nr:hypothetical protein SI65_05730 [Aspergillus cristatus]